LSEQYLNIKSVILQKGASLQQLRSSSQQQLSSRLDVKLSGNLAESQDQLSNSSTVILQRVLSIFT